MSRALFAILNQNWGDMRSALSPLFAGSKMRLMLSLMIKTIGDFNAVIEKQIFFNITIFP